MLAVALISALHDAAGPQTHAQATCSHQIPTAAYLPALLVHAHASTVMRCPPRAPNTPACTSKYPADSIDRCVSQQLPSVRVLMHLGKCPVGEWSRQAGMPTRMHTHTAIMHTLDIGAAMQLCTPESCSQHHQPAFEGVHSSAGKMSTLPHACSTVACLMLCAETLMQGDNCYHVHSPSRCCCCAQQPAYLLPHTCSVLLLNPCFAAGCLLLCDDSSMQPHLSATVSSPASCCCGFQSARGTA